MLIDAHTVPIHLHQSTGVDPVLNEAKKLGCVEVVCPYEGVSVGDMGAGALAVE